MSRFLIILGLMLVAAGLLWPWLLRLGLGRLPGDIAIRSEHGMAEMSEKFKKIGNEVYVEADAVRESNKAF